MANLEVQNEIGTQFYTGLQIIILLGRTNVWPSQKLVGHSLIFLGQLIKYFLSLPGHVSPQCNASKTEYIATSPNASVNYTVVQVIHNVNFYHVIYECRCRFIIKSYGLILEKRCLYCFLVAFINKKMC